jgi:hypothetical protein
VSFRVPNLRILGVVLITLALAACVYGGMLMIRTNRLPYNDRFAEGKMEEWAVYGGNWQIAGAVVSNNSDDVGSKVVTGSEALTDYEMTSDVSLTSSLGDTGVMVRVTDPEIGTNAFNGYYVGIRLPDQLLLGKMDYGYRPLKSVRIETGVKPYEWYHLTVKVEGCTLSAIASDEQGAQLAASSVEDKDDCDRHGAFGLRSFAAGGRWRGISVRELR